MSLIIVCRQRIKKHVSFLGTIPIPSSLTGFSRHAVLAEGFATVKSAVNRKGSRRDDYTMSKAMEYYKNEYTVAQFVRSALEKDSSRYDQVLRVVHHATNKRLDCVVAWNHLIQHNLSCKKFKQALSIFNDMKRRGQSPDAQTYTIIFRGMADAKHPANHVADALRVWRLLVADDRLNPNIIQLNALLTVCARGRDLESLYTVLGDVTERGPLAPDSITYSTVFNGLRAILVPSSHEAASSLDTEVAAQERLACIKRSKMIWADALRRWRAGRLVIDAPLVGAFGRLLQEGDVKDAAEIFDVVNQTMKIGPPNPSSSSPQDKDLISLTGNNFAVPDCSTLSLLLGACQKVHKGWAPHYWHTLTSPPYNVTPDSDNWHQYLRALRIAHASTKAMNAVVAMPPRFLAPKTFRISMSACLRDNLNQHSFDNAGKLLDVMSHSLEIPDPLSLRVYIRVALHSRRRAYAEQGEFGTAAYARQLTRALDRLWHPLRLAWDHAFGGAPMWAIPDVTVESTRMCLLAARDEEVKQKIAERQQGYRSLDLKVLDKEDRLLDEEEMLIVEGGRNWKDSVRRREAAALAGHLVSYNEQREVVAVARRMLAVFDRVLLIGTSTMNQRELVVFKKKRDELKGRVTRFFENREAIEPSLPHAIRKAQLLRERMRVEQARTRYQKNARLRYQSV